MKLTDLMYQLARLKFHTGDCEVKVYNDIGDQFNIRSIESFSTDGKSYIHIYIQDPT